MTHRGADFVTDLFGMVLAGGQSRRMGRDKGLLRYFSDAHREVLYALLKRYCARVFLSVNAHQPQVRPEAFEYLVDQPEYSDNGPIGAVLGFRDAHPGAGLLLVSCDLPFFDETAAEALLGARDLSRPATAFVNPENNRPEPLVTIYEAAFLEALPRHFAAGSRSLQKIMLAHNPVLITDFDPRWIHSADAPEDYERARRALSPDSGDQHAGESADL